MAARAPAAGSARRQPRRTQPTQDAPRAHPNPARVFNTLPARQPSPALPTTPPRELWLAVHLPQAQGLQRLALRSQRFTPRVNLEPPDGLLLEVQGSLHLFGGVEGLYRELHAECHAAGIQAKLALAPTASAALVGARSGGDFIAMSSEALLRELAPLPLTLLRWPPDALARLRKLNVRCIGQVLRLPRAGFAQRFGIELLEALDRLMGRRAVAQAPFKVAERFRERCDFPHELEQHKTILEALASMLEHLEKFLRAHQSGITTLQCRLHHRHAPATRCVLKLASPMADAKSLAECLSEHLARVRLPEPVRAAELRSGALILRRMTSDHLWQPGEQGGGVFTQTPQFLERIRARFGAHAVQVLQVRAEHRPEEAWRIVDLVAPAHKEQSAPWSAAHRPLWLLSTPQLLQERAGLPWHRGPLSLKCEPECIEAGWWDGQEVTRDYYSAVDVRGVRLWIFRERLGEGRWFLQGVFG